MKRVGLAVGPAHVGGLVDLVRELRAQHRRAGALVVALLPPLVQVRRVELPPLREGDLRRLLARDIEQYVPGVREPQVTAARRSPPAGYVLVTADAPLVSAVLDAAKQAGWLRCSVVPAYAAWEVAGRRLIGNGFLLVEQQHATEALQLRHGRVALVRRFRASVPADQVRSALGDDTVARLDEPEAVAAQYASQVRDFELVPDAVRAERARRDIRRAVPLFGLAAALLVLAAGVELWGRRRELAALRAERAMLVPRVAQAITLREAVDGLDRRLAVLIRAESAEARWSTVIATVAEHLPTDARLVSLRGNRDSLLLEGIARRAATTFEAFQRAPGIAGVRADAPIRQEARDSQPPIERFTLGARLTAR